MTFGEAPARASFKLSIVLDERTDTRSEVVARKLFSALRDLSVSTQVVLLKSDSEPSPTALAPAEAAFQEVLVSPCETLASKFALGISHCIGDFIWFVEGGARPKFNSLCFAAEALASDLCDVLAFNGAQEKLGGEEAAISFIAAAASEWTGSVAEFAQSVGLFSPVWTPSSMLIRRSIADELGLQKYSDILNDGFFAPWVLEIGANARLHFTNCDLISSLRHDAEVGPEFRSCRWLLALEELRRSSSLSENQLGSMMAWESGAPLHFVSVLLRLCLEEISSEPETALPAYLRTLEEYCEVYFPFAPTLTTLVRALGVFLEGRAVGLKRLETEARWGVAVRSAAARFREELEHHIDFLVARNWIEDFRVSAIPPYAIYRLGAALFIAATAEGSKASTIMGEAFLNRSRPPHVLRAASYADLVKRIGDYGASCGSPPIPPVSLAGPLQGVARSPTTVTGPSIVAAIPPPSTSVDGLEVERLRRSVALLVSELQRQDRKLLKLGAAPAMPLLRRLRPPAASRDHQEEPAEDAAAPTLAIGALLRLGTEEAADYLPRGFSFPEAWGRWTDQPLAVFRCSHERRDAPGLLVFDVQMVWRSDRPSASMTVSINSGAPACFVLTGPEELRISIGAREMQRPELEAVLVLESPKEPDDEPQSEARRLGVGLSSISLHWTA